MFVNFIYSFLAENKILHNFFKLYINLDNEVQRSMHENQHFRPASILFVPCYVKHNTSLGIKCAVKALVKLSALQALTAHFIPCDLIYYYHSKILRLKFQSNRLKSILIEALTLDQSRFDYHFQSRLPLKGK